MARKTEVVTISLPPKMVSWTNAVAKEKNMTRSELLRAAIRQYLEWQDTAAAIDVYKKELKAGKLKVLKGSLADLMRS